MFYFYLVLLLLMCVVEQEMIVPVNVMWHIVLCNILGKTLIVLLLLFLLLKKLVELVTNTFRVQFIIIIIIFSVAFSCAFHLFIIIYKIHHFRHCCLNICHVWSCMWKQAEQQSYLWEKLQEYYMSRILRRSDFRASWCDSGVK